MNEYKIIKIKKYKDELKKENRKVIYSTTILGISSLAGAITLLSASNETNELIIEKLILTFIADGTISLVAFKSTLESILRKTILINNIHELENIKIKESR